MKKYLSSLIAVAGSVAAFGPAAVFAQEANPVAPTQLVDPQNVKSAITAELGDWILVGIGIGVSVFIVYLGWRLLKRFTK